MFQANITQLFWQGYTAGRMIHRSEVHKKKQEEHCIKIIIHLAIMTAHSPQTYTSPNPKDALCSRQLNQDNGFLVVVAVVVFVEVIHSPSRDELARSQSMKLHITFMELSQ